MAAGSVWALGRSPCSQPVPVTLHYNIWVPLSPPKDLVSPWGPKSRLVICKDHLFSPTRAASGGHAGTTGEDRDVNPKGQHGLFFASTLALCWGCSGEWMSVMPVPMDGLVYAYPHAWLCTAAPHLVLPSSILWGGVLSPSLTHSRITRGFLGCPLLLCPLMWILLRGLKGAAQSLCRGRRQSLAVFPLLVMSEGSGWWRPAAWACLSPSSQDPVSAWWFSLHHPSQAISDLIVPPLPLLQSLNPEASGAHTKGGSNSLS